MNHIDNKIISRILSAHFIFVTALLIFSITLSYHAAWAVPAEDTSSTNKITAVILSDAPPTYFQNKITGEANGFAVEVTNEIAKRAGLNVSYIFAPDWEEIREKILRHDADIVPGLGFSKERDKDYVFTDPIDVFPVSFFVRSGSGIKEVKNGLTAGVIKGSLAFELLHARGDLKLITYDSFEKGLFDLLAGKIDAFCGPVPTFLELATEAHVENNITIAGNPITESKRAIGVRKDKPELLELLNKGIMGFVGSAEYRNIYTKWYGKPKPFLTVSKKLLSNTVIIFLAVIALVVWRYVSISSLNRRLKHEISERKRTEAELLKTHNLLKETQAVTKMGGWEYNVEENKIIWTDEVYRIYDVGRDFDPNDVGRAASFYAPESASVVERSFRRAVEACEPYDLEVNFTRANGEKIWVRTMGNPVIENGKVVRVTGNIMDITEKKKNEQELMKARNLESLGILAGGIAHDFNNLLQSLLGNISMAKHFIPETHKSYAFLRNAENAYSAASSLTNQLLAFASGGISVREIFPPSNLIRETVSFSLSGSTVKADYDISDGLMSIEVDPGQLRQVISNIVFNARDAMPDGGTILVRAVNEFVNQTSGKFFLGPGQYVKISIEDHGSGIEQENLSRIFDPYFSTKERGPQKGMGLGLTISDTIIRKHGGIITVDSEIGKGTTFNIYLPAIPEGNENAVSEMNAVIETAKPGTRILIMDDEPRIHQLASDYLILLGYRVDSALDGDKAISAYKKAMTAGDPYAVVILDLTVPGGMGGKEAVKILRKIDPGVKAIVSSGYANDPLMSDYASYGFAGGIIKPYRLEALKNMISKIL